MRDSPVKGGQAGRPSRSALPAAGRPPFQAAGRRPSGPFLNDDLAVSSLAAVGAGDAVVARRAGRSAGCADSTQAALPARAGRAAHAAGAAFGIAVEGARRDRLGDDGDVAALAAVAAPPGVAGIAARPAIAACARRIALVGRDAAVAAFLAVGAGPAGSAVAARATARVDVDPGDKIADFDDDVAAVARILAAGAVGPARALDAVIAALWRIVPVPVIDPVLAVGGLELGGAWNAVGAWRAIVATCNYVRHAVSPGW